MIEFEKEIKMLSPIAKIKVLGVGGAGGNTVNSMIDAKYQGIDFVVANTDAQALDHSKAEHKIQLGVKSTKGLGSGANPEVGKRAAEEDLTKIMDLVEDADIVFLTAGMGGGTGSGGLPVIARALKEKNILSIAVVTKPFAFEGNRRASVASQAIDQLRKEVDTLIVIPNQKLLEVVDHNVSMIDAFSMINGILNQSVKGIADIIAKPGHINVDFADVRTIMKDRGLAVMGTAKASGPDRALEAAISAISSPLFENMSIEGAKGVLLNISGGPNLGLHEISAAASIIYEQADNDASIILGSVIDQDFGDEVVVTVIATGFDRVKPTSQEVGATKTEFKEDVVVAQSKDETHKEVAVQSEPQKVVAQEAQEVQHEEQKLESQPTQQQVAPAMGVKQEVPHSLQPGTQVANVNDLDIPTFMRHQHQAQSE